MAKFGKTSLNRRETLHKNLQNIVDLAIEIFDFTIVCGHRGKEAQNKAYEKGKSEKQWPNSKHNKSPSMAVDLAPYDSDRREIDWMNTDKFILLAGVIIGIGHSLGIEIRWGGSWRGLTNIGSGLKDYGHFELK